MSNKRKPVEEHPVEQQKKKREEKEKKEEKKEEEEESFSDWSSRPHIDLKNKCDVLIVEMYKYELEHSAARSLVNS